MKKYLFFVSIVLVLHSCKRDDELNINDHAENGTPQPNQITGRVQKGPFNVGSAISIYELMPSLSPTGRVFEGQIRDNRGNFQISNVFLASSFVNIKAQGFYFNEITGTQSASQITLNCVSDITNKSSINVNLISDLEKPRIEYLISEGTAFNIAKKQAEQEILRIFNIHRLNLPEAELLDITHSGDDNAVLLAVSLILQGYRTEAELSNLLASISYDLSTDGILNDSTLGTALINDAKYLKLPVIRQNINTRWNALGINDSIPNFEKYINTFIDSTHYQFTNFITYPQSGLYGINLLNTSTTTYNSGPVSISAILPKGATLKIVGQFGIGVGTEVGWDFLGNPNGVITLKSNNSGLIQAYGAVSNNGYVKIFENDATTPTVIKNYIVQ